MRRRVWCEMVTHAEIARSEVLSALSSRRIGLLVAVQPGPLEELVRLSLRAAEEGLSIAFWPMLSNEEGRWASVSNASRFSAYVLGLVDELGRRGVFPAEIVLDMEPPIDRMQRALSFRPQAALELGDAGGAVALSKLWEELSARGISITAAVMPFLLFDRDWLGHGFERALGVPMEPMAPRHASVMMYSTLLEGYSRGFLRRRDVRPLLALCAKATKERFGGAAGLSLGAVGVGALGDEATYRDVGELRDDVAIARAAGVDDLALFDLGGVLRRAPMEAWLDAFVETEAAPALPPLSTRARAALVAGFGLSGLLGAFSRLGGRL